jgi:hypothetical protein
MVRDSYELDMRAGMVDVAEMKAEGLEVRVGKVETHPGIYQAALSGSGAVAAEKKIKDSALNHKYAISSLYPEHELGRSSPNFEGFECRWEPLRSRNGINLSLLVVARKADDTALYQSIMEKIGEICGQDADWKPVSKGQLDVSLNPLPLRNEAKVRTAGQGIFERLKYWAHITVMTWAGWYAFRTGKKLGTFDGAPIRKKPQTTPIS